MDKKLIKLIVLLILFLLAIILLIYICINKTIEEKRLNKKHIIESEEIFSEEMGQNTGTFYQWLLKDKNKIIEYLPDEIEKNCGIKLPKNIMGILENIDLNKYSIFFSTKHEAREFSYQMKNQKYSFGRGEDILDVTFAKQETNKLYIYKLSHAKLRSWEFTKVAPPETIFLD